MTEVCPPIVRPRRLDPLVARAARGRTRIGSTCLKVDKVETPTSPAIAGAGVAGAASARRAAALVVAESASSKEGGKKPSTPGS